MDAYFEKELQQTQVPGEIFQMIALFKETYFDIKIAIPHDNENKKRST